MARLLSASRTPLRRSLVFLFTAGEEKGLLGARYYCAHPALPLSHAIANLNVDGLAFLDRFREIVGVGAEWSTLEDHLVRVATASGLTVGRIPAVFGASRAFLLSDQFAFAEAGVPAILVMEGLHYEHLDEREGRQAFIRWGRERYHTPFDDLQQPLDQAAAVQHLEVLIDFVVDLANTFEAPQWKPGAPYAAARLRSLAREN
jgi:Zn-dependent M28 family amino/carboxypeptidase